MVWKKRIMGRTSGSSLLLVRLGQKMRQNKNNLHWIFSLVSDRYPCPQSKINAISRVASKLVTRSHHNAWRPWLGKRQVKTATLDQGIYLWWIGYFVTIVGGHCRYRSLFESVEMVPFLSCNRDILRNRSTLVKWKFWRMLLDLLYKHQWNIKWAFTRKLLIFTRENNMSSSHVKGSPSFNLRSDVFFFFNREGREGMIAG